VTAPASPILRWITAGLLLAAAILALVMPFASSPIPARTLVLVDGLITTLLGGLLIAHWPSDSVWALGTLFASGLAISAVNLLTSPSARIASTTEISTAA